MQLLDILNFAITTLLPVIFRRRTLIEYDTIRDKEDEQALLDFSHDYGVQHASSSSQANPAKHKSVSA